MAFWEDLDRANPLVGGLIERGDIRKSGAERTASLGEAAEATRGVGARSAAGIRGTRNVYDPAGNTLQDYKNKGGPSASRNFYKETNWYGPTNQESEFRNMGPAPTYQRDWYEQGKYKTSPYLRTLLNSRRDAGAYDRTPVRDRYQSRMGEAANRVSNAQRMFSSPADTTGEVANAHANIFREAMGPTATGSYLKDLQSKSWQDKPLQDALYDLTRSYTAGSDAFGRTLKNYDSGRYAGEESNRLAGNSFGLGKLAADAASGNTQTGSVLADLRAGKSNTGRFLGDFDPNKTLGLQSTYDKLAAEGPTAEERFYETSLAGENPFVERQIAKTRDAANRAAAARGSFVAGRSAMQANEAEADLRAKEFQQMGALAGQAGTARRARLGQQLEGASALDQFVGGQQRFKGTLGQDADALVASTAGKGDDIRLGAEGRRADLLADLAKSRDADRRGVLDLEGDNARFGDTQGLAAARARADVANNMSLSKRDRDRLVFDAARGADTSKMAALDLLRGSAADVGARRGADATLRLNAGTSADDDWRALQNDLDRGAANTGEEDRAYRKMETDDAYRASQEEGEEAIRGASAAERSFREWAGERDARQAAAAGADNSRLGMLGAQSRAANDAGREENDAFDRIFGGQMKLGGAHAGLERDAIDSESDSELKAIDLLMQKAGVPAEVRQQLAESGRKDTKQLIEIAKLLRSAG